jgi:hypothetical protein
MSAQHTPGPWACGSNFIEGPDGRSVIETVYPMTVANARLIAAGPDLFAAGIDALQELRRLRDVLANAGQIDEPLAVNNHIKRLKAALAKASDRDLSRSAIANATGEA